MGRERERESVYSGAVVQAQAAQEGRLNQAQMIRTLVAAAKYTLADGGEDEDSSPHHLLKFAHCVSRVILKLLYLAEVAYVDPSDPSVLYLSQPTAVAGSEACGALSSL